MMYLGSVKFFRHLILTIITLLIIGLATKSVLLGISNNQLKEQLSQVEATASQWELEQAQAELFRTDFGQRVDYQLTYPDLYADNKEDVVVADEPMVYLTFDDGPSKLTPKVLDILDHYQIKATFFVIYKEDEYSKNILKDIVERGHTLAIHSASHNYKAIYASVEGFLDDYNRMFELIKETTGVAPDIFRFPGGSINAYNQGIYQEIISEMLRRGFTYYDWNVSSGDAAKRPTMQSVYNNVVYNCQNKKKSIVLMHDSGAKTYTVAALPKIIEALQQQGFRFAALDSSVKPFTFEYIN